MDFRDGESTAKAELLRLDFDESRPCLRYITAERYWSALNTGPSTRRALRMVCYCSGCCHDDTLFVQLGLLAISSFFFFLGSICFQLIAAFLALFVLWEDSYGMGPMYRNVSAHIIVLRATY